MQPGTRIRNNLIHDIASFTYGGWGIYPDEGSSEMLIENNIVYHCKSAGFHQHYGRENVVRNNIFAFNRENQLMRTRAEPHVSFTLRAQHRVLRPGPSAGQQLERRGVHDGRQPVLRHARARTSASPGRRLRSGRPPGTTRSRSIADPLFVNAGNFDFRLRPESPALKMGFQQIDMSTVGPRVPAGQ